MGKEEWFIVAYVVSGAGSGFIAGWLVWTRPRAASRFLFIGGLLASILAGRYLWVSPLYGILAFGLPGVMLLLAWSNGGIADRSDGRRSSAKATFTLAQLFLITTAAALVLAHGRLAWVPAFTPTPLILELDGAGCPPDLWDQLQRLRREKRDAKSILQNSYGIDFDTTSGGGGYVALELRRFFRPGGRYHADLRCDLETAMQSLVLSRGLQIEHHRQSPGRRLAREGLSDGFSIRYRSRDAEGLMQAAARPGRQSAVMYIEERARRN
ncbi:MAG: hypothetical protein HUU20_08025 [Pirellulales bacterium]|nr:hypothetical protein [Pirellulales bacterium]